MNFSDPRMMALLSAGGALLQSSGASPRPINLGEAMGNAIPAGIQGAQTAQGFQLQEMLQKKAHDEALQKIQAQEFLQKHQEQGTDPRTLIQQAAMSANPFLMQMAGNMAKSLPTVKFTKEGLDAQGNPTLHNIMSTGEVMPTGVTPLERLMQVNEGNQITLRGQNTGQVKGSPIGMGINPGQAASLAQSARHHADSMGIQRQNQGIAQQNSDVDRQIKLLQLDPEFQARRAEAIAGGRESGKFKSEVAVALPETLGVLAESLNISDDLKNHPALESMVGSLPTRTIGKGLALYGGNNEADFSAKMEQSQGKQFISAIQSMRGFGSLTEREGDKMQSSAAAMSTAQSPAAFKKAQDDYQAALLSGVRKIAFKMGVPEQDVLNMLKKERINLRNDSGSAKPNTGGVSGSFDDDSKWSNYSVR